MISEIAEDTIEIRVCNLNFIIIKIVRCIIPIELTISPKPKTFNNSSNCGSLKTD